MKALASVPASFDAHLSASLHNQILCRGWTGATGLSFEESTLTWWDAYGFECDATGVASKLCAELVQFLRSARVVRLDLLVKHAALYDHFFYYLTGLVPHDELFSEYLDVVNPDEPDRDRYVVLYFAAHIMSHSFGLIFDQHTLTARVIFSITMDDTVVPDEQRPWIPLQDILAAYVDMLDLGKITVDGDDDDGSDAEDETEKPPLNPPWLLNPHSDAILDRSVAAFGRLLKAIEARMPPPVSSSVTEKRAANLGQAAERLVSTKQVSDNNFIVKLFGRIDGLVGSAPPELSFIAPGLLVPGQELTAQPFEGVDCHASPCNNPILLFRGELADGTRPRTTFAGGVWNPFRSPYKEKAASDFPSGLWLAENDLEHPDFDDACRLLLPDVLWPAAAAGEPPRHHHARSTDGFLLQPSRTHVSANDGEGLAAGLYQTSCNAVMPRHEVPLFRVLEHWVHMVEDGAWPVDGRGVAGGMEKWAEADQSDALAEKYRLPYTW